MRLTIKIPDGKFCNPVRKDACPLLMSDQDPCHNDIWVCPMEHNHYLDTKDRERRIVKCQTCLAASIPDGEQPCLLDVTSPEPGAGKGKATVEIPRVVHKPN